MCCYKLFNIDFEHTLYDVQINVSSLDFVSCNDQANNVLNRKAACDFEEPSSRDFNVCIRCCREWKSPTALGPCNLCQQYSC